MMIVEWHLSAVHRRGYWSFLRNLTSVSGMHAIMLIMCFMLIFPSVTHQLSSRFLASGKNLVFRTSNDAWIISSPLYAANYHFKQFLHKWFTSNACFVWLKLVSSTYLTILLADGTIINTTLLIVCREQFGEIHCDQSSFLYIDYAAYGYSETITENITTEQCPSQFPWESCRQITNDFVPFTTEQSITNIRVPRRNTTCSSDHQRPFNFVEIEYLCIEGRLGWFYASDLLSLSPLFISLRQWNIFSDVPNRWSGAIIFSLHPSCSVKNTPQNRLDLKWNPAKSRPHIASLWIDLLYHCGIDPAYHHHTEHWICDICGRYVCFRILL